MVLFKTWLHLSLDQLNTPYTLRVPNWKPCGWRHCYPVGTFVHMARCLMTTWLLYKECYESFSEHFYISKSYKLGWLIECFPVLFDKLNNFTLLQWTLISKVPEWSTMYQASAKVFFDECFINFNKAVTIVFARCVLWMHNVIVRVKVKLVVGPSLPHWFHT